MGWIDLPQDRDRRPDVVNEVRSLRCSKMERISWPSEEMLDSQEELCVIELFS